MSSVFISWSGDTSKLIASELRDWIPAVLQFAKPYFTPSDVEKGTKWSSEISGKLSESSVGIICLTPDNLERPWILFESGALSKGIDSARVCTLLFDVENSDVTGPLTTFQSTNFDKTDFKRLLLTINETGEDLTLDQGTFDRVYEQWWPELEAKIAAALKKAPYARPDSRSQKAILEEILTLSRLNATNSERAIGIQDPLPLLHFYDVANRLVDSAIKHTDYELLMMAEEMLSAGSHFNRKVIDSAKVLTTSAELKQKISDARFSFVRNADEEVPF